MGLGGALGVCFCLLPVDFLCCLHFRSYFRYCLMPTAWVCVFWVMLRVCWFRAICFGLPFGVWVGVLVLRLVNCLD